MQRERGFEWRLKSILNERYPDITNCIKQNLGDNTLRFRKEMMYENLSSISNQKRKQKRKE